MLCLKTSFDSVKIAIDTLLYNQDPGMVSHHNESTLSELHKQRIVEDIFTITSSSAVRDRIS